MDKQERAAAREELLNGLVTLDLEPNPGRRWGAAERVWAYRTARLNGARVKTRIIVRDEYGQGPYMLVWRVA